MTEKFLGRHLLIEFYGCEINIINNKDLIREALLEASERANATIVAEVFHTFSPHGVSGVVVIAESHVAIHTWPERGYAAVDIFSCGTRLDHDAIRDCIAQGLRAREVETRELTRGHRVGVALFNT